MQRASRFLSRIPRDEKVPADIRAYLRKPPLALALAHIVFSIPLLLLGALVFLIVFNPVMTVQQTGTLIFWCFIWGTAPLLVGFALLIIPTVVRSARKISDQVFDHQLQNDIYLLSQRALHKIQINVPGHPGAAGNFGDCVVTEPTSWCTGISVQNEKWGRFDDAVPAWKLGSDGVMRYRIYRFAALFLAEHHLAYYVCDFNLETGLILHESTTDCHYKDVEAIIYAEKQLRAIELPAWWQVFDELLSVFKISEFLVIMLRRMIAAISTHSDFSIRAFDVSLGGEFIRIPVRITEHCESFESGSSVDPLISKIRFLLRDKRMSHVRLTRSSAY